MRKLLIVLLVGWAIAFFGSFIAFAVTAPTDTGLDAGINRLSVFMRWQMAATAIAVVCLGLRWTAKEPAFRRWAAVPSLGIGVLVLALGGLYLWAGMQVAKAPVIEADPKPVTEVLTND